MHAPVKLFVGGKRAQAWQQRAAFGLLRAVAYFILGCASFVFLHILGKGSGALLTRSAPYINFEFLLASPETLHVFEFEGVRVELGDRAFRQFAAAHPGVVLNADSYVYSAGGIFPCIVGTILLVMGSMAIALFFGISSAIFLSEYSRDSRFVRAVRLAVSNLAGVPSIVFGLFGMGLFVVFMPLLQPFDNPAALSLPVGFGYYLNFSGWNVCLLSGWFTLAFMALPVVITASEEALKSVPRAFREGALALGATRWQAIRSNVLPYALPGMLTSSILAIARVAGETAPIMFTAAYVVRDKLPWEVARPLDLLFQGVMALPYHIYVVSAKIPQNAYTERVQYGTACVFLAVVSAISLTSIILRARMRKRYRW